MNVGEYIRDNKGNIAKIIELERENNWLTVRYDNVFNHTTGITYNLIHFKNEEEILEYNHIKSSPNIIDLIEVGDYVNGYYVEDIRHRYDGEMITILEVATGSNYFQAPMYEEDIKSIVTKEQFEGCEYKI